MSYLTPNRIVKIEGEPLPQDISGDVISVSCEEHFEEAGAASLVINNQNNKWVDAALFTCGKTIEILLGYGQDLPLLFKGKIQQPEASFPQDGASTLTLRAYDLSYAMRQASLKPQAVFKEISDAELVKKIVTQYGFSQSVLFIDDTSEIVPYVAQGDRTDWEFLKERADRLNMELFVKGQEFYFQKQKEFKPSMSSEYGLNLNSFEPRLTTYDQPQKVIVRGWDAERKQPITAEAVSHIFKTETKEDEQVRILYDKFPGSQKEAEDLAQSYLAQKQFNLIEAQGACIGEPGLRARGIISVSGVGRKYSGDYYLTRVTHSFDDSGYLCEFECQKSELSQ